jgi:hypothetical protein
MAWEIFNRKVTRVSTPAISVSAEGRVNLNKGVTKRLKDNAVEHVLLLWDKDNYRIGLRPITKRDSRAFRVLYGQRENSASMFAKAFFDHIQYDRSERRQLHAEWLEDDGMFSITVPRDAIKDSKQGSLDINHERPVPIRRSMKNA